jgi:hypothetical protein
MSTELLVDGPDQCGDRRGKLTLAGSSDALQKLEEIEFRPSGP